MPARQTWPLSQDANKKSGICAVCLAQRQLHAGDGRVHLHGPRDNRCPGSNQPPLQNTVQAAATQPAPIVPGPVSRGGVPSSSSSPPQRSPTPPAPLLAGAIVDPGQSPCFQHPCSQRPAIKHIPKSARPTCATALAEVFRTIVSDPWALPP